MTTLSALIVGCGNIAGGFDSDRGARSEQPLTHAGAYSRDGRFRMAACIDPDDARRESFMRTWSIARGFRTIDEAAAASDGVDVVSICSPTESHARDIAGALALRPKLVFCEKPVATSARDADAALQRCRKSGAMLAVNYTRRWDPAVAELRAGIAEGRWGALRSAVGYYNKGLLNNGSHLIDLLLFLFGKVGIKAVGAPVDDHSPEDASVPAWLELAGAVPVHIACGDARDFAFFELQLVFADAVITMEESGMSWRERRPVASSMFRGYRVLDRGAMRPGGYPKAMLAAVDNIYEAVEHGAPLASTGESALAAQRLCEEIRRS
jgi:predicted dehydrogenase